jgi:hypothetical protein
MTARLANRSSQRGAGMLMATVFLLVIVALFGLVGLRMAGTDITDTAVQNDSVEALFLAESGLERATQRLAAGTTCAALVPDATQALGRGDFQIQSANVVGSLCRVRVLGRVLLGGTLRAQRLIEGDLSVSSGGWAVGLNRTIVYWNGSAWTTAGFTNGTPAGRDLFAVYCVSASDCWAVGQNGTIVRGNGSNWTTAGFTNGAPGGEDLFGVHCPDSNTCWAVGQNGTIVRWNGGSNSWTNITGAANDAPDNRDLNAVYCLSATSCWAVGERDSGDGTIVRLVGSNWVTSGFTNNTPNAHLRGVACPAANLCWAVGNTSGGAETIVRWNGAWGDMPSYAGVPNVRLNAVHCINTSSCWAVGNTSSSRGTIIFGNGASWTAAGITNNSPNQTLNAVHCSPGGDCWAVGNGGASVRLSGTTWSTVAMPTTENLRGVSFPSGSGGGGSGLRVWREIIQ